MTTTLRNLMAATTVVACGAMPAAAETVVYFGAGTNHEEDMVTDETPFSVGAMIMSDERDTVFGFDIAGEGEMLDSTFGGDSMRQAYSLNLLVGANVYRGTGWRADAMFLVGGRETFADCADSYLGYQCYADTAPSTEYDWNYGAVVSATFNRVSVGVRATGESGQVIAGFQF